MKITAFLLLVICLHVTARTVGQTVTLKVKDAPMRQVFREIQKQTGLNFMVDETVVEKAGKVTLDVKNMPVSDVLNLCLKNEGLSFTISDGKIVVKETKNSIAASNENFPPINVHGHITDSLGRILSGATILVKGTNIAAVSDINGDFTLTNILPNATLIVSHIGYEKQEFRVNGRAEINILLRIERVQLKDVEVIYSNGYQTISKERAVGSFSQVDSATFQRRAGMAILDRLDGTVPGMLFNRKANGEFPIQIRGISTLGVSGTNTSPLIVVDNFPMGTDFSIDDINPYDVESVTVLKDAAAASIWGTRAGNGVIVITTRKGKYNQRFNVTLSSNIAITEKPNLFYTPTIKPSDFINIEQFLFSQGYYDASLSDPTYPVVSPVVDILARQRDGTITADAATSQIDSLRRYDVRNDLKKYIYRDAVAQQHYLNVSGGSNLIAYQLSFGFNQSLNNTQGSKPDNQFTINHNATFRPIRRLEISEGINYVYSIDRSYSFSTPNPLYPYQRLVDDKGNPVPIPFKYNPGYVDTVGGGTLLDWHYSPQNEIRDADNSRIANFIRLNAGAVYSITDWLKASVNYQYSIGNTTNRDDESVKTFNTRDLINIYTNPEATNPNLRNPLPIGGILYLSNSNTTSYNARGNLALNKSWSGLHQLTALAGAEISSGQGYGSIQRIYGYNDQIASYNTSIDYYNQYPLTYAAYQGSAAFIPSGNGYSESPSPRFVSLLANAAYTYNNRYNVYVSARRDGANIFGVNTNNRWKPLWSAGAGWDLSKEGFYKVHWLPYLKLRASYGYTGNVNNTLSGKFIINYQPNPALFTNLPYSNSGLAPNPDLRWEQVGITNLGLDFQLLKHWLSGSVDVYQKDAKDVISTEPQAPTSGVNTYTLNYASLRTKGFDLVLSTNKINLGPVHWDISLGMSYAESKVRRFYNSTGYTAQNYVAYGLNTAAGQMVYGLASYRWAGLDPATGDPQGYLHGHVSKDYQSIFNDSVGNQVFHGSSLPLYSGFLTNSFSWKGFSLSFIMTGKFKYFFRQPTLALDYSGMGSSPILADYYNRWQKPGDEKTTNVPSMPYPIPYSVNLRSIFYEFAAINVRKGDNIRLQDVRLAWQWDNQKKYIPVRSVQFFVYPNNLNIILWRADKSHWDPEYAGSGSGLDVPPPKTWTAGVNINF